MSILKNLDIEAKRTKLILNCESSEALRTYPMRAVINIYADLISTVLLKEYYCMASLENKYSYSYSYS